MVLSAHMAEQVQTSSRQLTSARGVLALLGQNWLGYLHFDWKKIAYHACGSVELEKVLQPYAEVFADELGTVQSMTITLAVNDGSQLKFYWPYSVPFAIKGAIEAEIDR